MHARTHARIHARTDARQAFKGGYAGRYREGTYLTKVMYVENKILYTKNELLADMPRMHTFKTDVYTLKMGRGLWERIYLNIRTGLWVGIYLQMKAHLKANFLNYYISTLT
jgi:hypothetical protein